MKKIIVCLLLLHVPFLASDRLPLIDITQLGTHHQDFNRLDYTALMEKKLQHQECADSLVQSLVTIDEKVRLAEFNVNKYSQLFQKEEKLLRATQENLSLDVAHAILTQYKKQDEERTLSVEDRPKMHYMDVYLKELQKQIGDAVASNKNIGISQILAFWPCNQIKANLTSLCLEHQHQMLALYQNNMQNYQDELAILYGQKRLKIQEQSFINSALAKMNELSPELLAAHNKKIAQNIKSAILLQSLYRMKLAQKKPQIMTWQKYRAIKHDVVEPVIDDICDKVFSVVQAQEKAKSIAAREMQNLLDKQEFERKQAEKIRLQIEAETTKEKLRLQSIAAIKVQKVQQRKAARQLQKEKEQKIVADLENARLAAVAKDEADKVLLDALILENRRKNVSSIITLAEHNVANIKDIFNDAAVPGNYDKPLSRAMFVVVHYVEQFGLSTFDKNKFFDAAVEHARIVKGHNFKKDDAEKRAVVLQGLMQIYFESIIRNNDSCVAPCSDVQAANLAKLHNLLVDFLEDKFDF